MRISEGPRILWVSHYCETQRPRIAYAKARKSVRRPRSYHVFRLETDSCQRIRKRDRQFFGLKCAARGAAAAKGASHTQASDESSGVRRGHELVALCAPVPPVTGRIAHAERAATVRVVVVAACRTGSRAP
jgi:hypothetical protein